MVRLAAGKYPHLKFQQMSGEHLDLPAQKFDFIVLSDLIGYLYDIRLVFERLRTVCHSRTRLIINWYSQLWQPILQLAEKVGLKYPQPLVNWTTPEDIINLLYLAGYEIVHRRGHVLLPKQGALLSMIATRYLWHHWGFPCLCFGDWAVARPLRLEHVYANRMSVICPW